MYLLSGVTVRGAEIKLQCPFSGIEIFLTSQCLLLIHLYLDALKISFYGWSRTWEYLETGLPHFPDTVIMVLQQKYILFPVRSTIKSQIS